MRNVEVITRGLVIADSQVLLCTSKRGGYAYLPGGHVEFGEPAAAALRREFREETGLAVVVGPLLAIAEVVFSQAGRPRHEIDLVFHVEPWARCGLERVVSHEPDIEFEWRKPDDFSDLRIYPEIVRTWLLERLRSSAIIAHSPFEAYTHPVFLSSSGSA